MPRLTTDHVVDDAGLARLLSPRADVVVEVPDEASGPGGGSFALGEGPFDRWQRRVDVRPGPDGRHAVREVVDYRLAVPVWRFLFAVPLRGAVRRPLPPGQVPWWSPPDRLDARGSETLSLLAVFAVVTGYLGTLLSQTNTYVKDELGASNSEISWLLIGVRVGGLLAVVLAARADRLGRRRVLIGLTVGAILTAATGAFAPDLVWLGASQTVARAFATAIALVVAIMAAEEVPSGSRAFALSLLTMAGALGAGGVVISLGLADLAPWAWRGFYLFPLVVLWPVLVLARRLQETRRFEVHEVARSGDEGPARLSGEHRSRFALLAASALLLAVFTTPASGFFNEYFRTEQGFSGAEISLLQVLTNLPGGIALVVGGRLADRYGRRIVGAVGAIGGTGFTMAMYLSSGWGIWAFSTLATLLGALTVPALGVYGPELFPTASRGRTNGWINVLGVVGSVVGLLVAGYLADRWGSFGPAMAVLGVGPFLVGALVLVAYPETTHRELEELNPEDAPVPVGHDALDRLDEAAREVEEAQRHPRRGPAGGPG